VARPGSGVLLTVEAPESTMSAFLTVLAIIFSVPYLVWRLARTERHVPLFVVQILTGVLLGPALAGRLLPEAYATLFTGPVMQSLTGISTWAVAVFVWLAGVELDVRQAWANRRECLVTAGLALAFPLVLGAFVAMLLALDSRWMGAKASGLQFVAGVGMACAVTALPVLILLLEKLEIFRTRLGQRLLAYASLDDIAIWVVLALILMDLERIGLQCAFLAGFAASSVGYRRLMRRLGPSDRWLVAVIWLVAAACAAEGFGLHFMIGAFLAGAVTNAEWFDERRTTELRYGVLLLLMPVYFLVTGLRTEWGVDSATVLVAAGALLAAAVGGKLLGVWLAGRILRWARDEALVIGWMLQTKGLIMIVFASVLLDKGVISQETFTALLMMGLVSTILTVPIVKPRLAGYPTWR
jgi:Kef-type K+ transport system membrane component KefB